MTARANTKKHTNPTAIRKQVEANGSSTLSEPEAEHIPSDSDEARGRGRPTKYQPEFARIAETMCKLGATDAELAAAFNVDTTTIWRWQSLHDEFCNALMVGKEPADNRVVRGLFQRAVGYTFDSEKVFNHQGTVVRAKTTEHVPPDPGAAKLWLCNRLPDEWRDTAKVEVTGRNGVPLQIEAVAAVRALLEAMPELGATAALPALASAVPAAGSVEVPAAASLDGGQS